MDDGEGDCGQQRSTRPRYPEIHSTEKSAEEGVPDNRTLACERQLRELEDEQEELLRVLSHAKRKNENSDRVHSQAENHQAPLEAIPQYETESDERWLSVEEPPLLDDDLWVGEDMLQVAQPVPLEPAAAKPATNNRVRADSSQSTGTMGTNSSGGTTTTSSDENGTTQTGSTGTSDEQVKAQVKGEMTRRISVHTNTTFPTADGTEVNVDMRWECHSFCL